MILTEWWSFRTLSENSPLRISLFIIIIIIIDIRLQHSCILLQKFIFVRVMLNVRVQILMKRWGINKLGFLHPNDLFYFWLNDSPSMSPLSNYIRLVSKPRLLSNWYIKVGGVTQHGISILISF